MLRNMVLRALSLSDSAHLSDFLPDNNSGTEPRDGDFGHMCRWGGRLISKWTCSVLVYR